MSNNWKTTSIKSSLLFFLEPILIICIVMDDSFLFLFLWLFKWQNKKQNLILFTPWNRVAITNLLNFIVEKSLNMEKKERMNKFSEQADMTNERV